MTTFDLASGESLGTTCHRGIGVGFFAKDAPTLVTLHGVEPGGPFWTCVWDVPHGTPWRWIVGAPLAVGAALLGTRWTWRRWRAKPAAA